MFEFFKEDIFLDILKKKSKKTTFDKCECKIFRLFIQSIG